MVMYNLSKKNRNLFIYGDVMKKVLYLTDLYYKAKGRNYYEEDIFITRILKDYFDIVLCNPRNSESYEKDVDLIVFRNTGSVSGFQDTYDQFVSRVRNNKLRTFNEFSGKADMRGKQYLLDLTSKGYPVIPTVDSTEDIAALHETERFVIKPKNGADSIGLEFLSRSELLSRDLSGRKYLIQPAIDFRYEVSFYFLNDVFEYALYAPEKEQRWKLKKYEASGEDIEFAKKFIKWNDINYGIQRVDACRTQEGELLLVELEDLNPYLSILELDKKTQDKFIGDMIKAMKQII